MEYLIKFLVGLFSGPLPILFIILFGGTALSEAFSRDRKHFKLSGGITIVLLTLAVISWHAQDKFDLEECMKYHMNRPILLEECYQAAKDNRWEF
ncbi:hypothetical protein OAP82_10175 [Paracoccaceae bacterium]|nr:hypothetical protein [Paracoccaceae bacterium]